MNEFLSQILEYVVWNIFIIFGRGIDKDQKACRVQEYSHFLHYVLVSPNAEILCRP